MPLYEYQCENCSEVFELIQKFSDEPLTLHEKCGGTVHRLISRSALQFKGSGWYVNDYAKSGSAANGGKKDGEAGSSSGSKESPGSSAESKDSKSSDKSSESSKSSSTAAPASSTPAAPSDKK